MDLYLQGCTPAHNGVQVIDGDTNKVLAISPDSFAALEYIARIEILMGVPEARTLSALFNPN